MTVKQFTSVFNYQVNFKIIEKSTNKVLKENCSMNVIPKEIKEKEIYMVFPESGNLLISVY